MEQLLMAVVILIVIAAFWYIMTLNTQVSGLKEEQRLDDLEDSQREKELGDLKYRQDRYDRYRYWSGPYWNRPWRRWGRGGRRGRRHGGHH